MSEKKQVVNVCKGPFGTRKDYEGKKDFDKYYFNSEIKEVFKASGEVDPDTGEQLGVVEEKVIVKKIDIRDMIQSQADSVGVASYMRALSLQGEDISDFNTQVNDKIDDYSEMPGTLAEVMTAGDKAKVAFANLDPGLKGGHTTIEGFLNDLTQDKIDAFIKAKIEAQLPVQRVQEKEGD